VRPPLESVFVFAIAAACVSGAASEPVITEWSVSFV